MRIWDLARDSGDSWRKGDLIIIGKWFWGKVEVKLIFLWLPFTGHLWHHNSARCNAKKGIMMATRGTKRESF